MIHQSTFHFSVHTSFHISKKSKTKPAKSLQIRSNIHHVSVWSWHVVHIIYCLALLVVILQIHKKLKNILFEPKKNCLLSCSCTIFTINCSLIKAYNLAKNVWALSLHLVNTNTMNSPLQPWTILNTGREEILTSLLSWVENERNLLMIHGTDLEKGICVLQTFWAGLLAH